MDSTDKTDTIVDENSATGGAHSVKHLKRMLKKAGLKTTGKKAALTRRAKKAGLKGGQVTTAVGLAAKTAKGTVRGVIDIGKAVVEIPVRALRAAIGPNGKTRRG